MTLLQACKNLVRRVQELENPLNIVSREQLDALEAIEEAERGIAHDLIIHQRGEMIGAVCTCAGWSLLTAGTHEQAEEEFQKHKDRFNPRNVPRTIWDGKSAGGGTFERGE